MHYEILLIGSGDSSSIVLPSHVMERHGLKNGERAILVETEEGLLITRYDAMLARATTAASHGMNKYRNALKELAE